MTTATCTKYSIYSHLRIYPSTLTGGSWRGQLDKEDCTGGGTPFPATEQVLILLVAELSQSITYSSIRTYLAAICHLHVARGFGDQLKGRLQLELLLKGNQRKKVKKKDTRLPVTPLVLRMIRSEVDKAPREFENILLWAMCCLGFYGFLRSGEFTCLTTTSFDSAKHLTYQDIAINSRHNPTIMRVHLKYSKTDQLGQGLDIYIGATHNNICSIVAILS